MTIGVEPDRLLTRSEAAELLKLRPQTLAKWSLTGLHLPVVRVGTRAVRYKLSDVRRLIERGVQPAAED
jgi:predicted site-specific integrase-resolvase